MTRDTASRIARSIGAAALLTSTVALFAAPAQARVAPDDPPTASSSQHSTKTQIEYQERTGASGSTDPFTTLHQAERAARAAPVAQPTHAPDPSNPSSVPLVALVLLGGVLIGGASVAGVSRLRHRGPVGTAAA